SITPRTRRECIFVFLCQDTVDEAARRSIRLASDVYSPGVSREMQCFRCVKSLRRAFGRAPSHGCAAGSIIRKQAITALCRHSPFMRPWLECRKNISRFPEDMFMTL